MTEKPLNERILDILQEADGEYLTPQDIAHRTGFSRPYNQASKVNPTLYELLDANKIIQQKTDGRKPMYSLYKESDK